MILDNSGLAILLSSLNHLKIFSVLSDNFFINKNCSEESVAPGIDNNFSSLEIFVEKSFGK